MSTRRFASTTDRVGARTVRRAAAGAVVSMLVVLAGCGSDSGSGKDDLQQVNFGMSSPNMAANWVAVAVAQDRGYFKDEGIKVDDQLLNTSGEVLQAMAAGRTDMGAPTPEAVLAGIDQGQKVKMVYEWTRRPVAAFAVDTSSKIDAISDLKDARIGVQSSSAGPALLAKASLTQQGVSPKDVEFVEVGVGAAAFDALRRDRVDALMLYDTQYAGMERIGAKLRLMRADGVDDLFATTLVANDDFLKDHEKAVIGFGRAWTKASIWALENPEAAIKIMWKLYPESKAGGDSEEEQMDTALAIFKARMEAVDVGQPTENHLWGKYDPKAVAHWVEFAHDNALTKSALEPDKIFTNEFADAYNDFDAAKVKADAKKAG